MSATFQRILAAARSLFAARGYRATSMQVIADEVGITKAALYYHFASKDEILRHLTLPLLEELEDALGDAERAGDAQTVRWRAIEGYVEVHLRHRQTLLMLVQDMTLLVQAPLADRFRAAIALANELVCGPERSLEWRVRASQVVAGLGDPVVLFLDAPAGRIRRHILDGARALLLPLPPAAAAAEAEAEAGRESGDAAPARPPCGSDGDRRPRGRPRGRGGGRPAALTELEARQARDSYAAGDSVEQIAVRLGVSRATIYRCLKN